ncbi:MAG: AmmeMemoRadiSam system radical SAM enzyme [candidate division Zixibacteria bacterium]|nr:AmmeMemoRadiSam system radical SAM enzyme [candidate division Zixibacteria bacterium]
MKKLKRRDFFKCSLSGVGGILSSNLISRIPVLSVPETAYALSSTGRLSHVEAKYYKKLEHKEIECQLCPRKCKVGDRERGYCGVRENQKGIYYTLVYGLACSFHTDPIEKKPFFHFYPGSSAFSIATAGCNLNCKFCQNWEISQARPEQTYNIELPPQSVVEYALKENAKSISYTYTEPVIFYEYMLDCAKLGREKGIKSVMVSGGYVEPEPLVELCKNLDAVKIDLKAFTDEFYKDICRGRLQPVLECLKELNRMGIWYEIVYLMVPTLNDDMSSIRKMCQWILANLSPDVPIHFTRFTPMYLLKNLPLTPVSSLEKAREIALETGLKFVYVGNVPGHKAENTFCPKCQQMLIGRYGFTITRMNLQKGKCKFCGEKIPGVWA